LILVASFMAVLDFTIVNIALPSMERDFGVATLAAYLPVIGWTFDLRPNTDAKYTDNRADSRRWAQGVGPGAGEGQA
jgi:hypothetical protein